MSAVDAELVEQIRTELAVRAQQPTAAAVAQVLRDRNRLVGGNSVLSIVENLKQDHGFGVLSSLVETPGVTDVLVNGPDQVYIDRGSGLERTAVKFESEKHVRRFAQRLAASAGRRLDDASPFVDARLPGGIRLHAVLAPIVQPGTAISLRVMAKQVLTIANLQELGMFDADLAKILRAVMQSRFAFVISGGTGAGKTTLLSALLSDAQSDQRVVIVEDSTELMPQHPHFLSLESRPSNIEGAGLITMRDLVRQALRMRPDRLVIGEVRGAEIVEMLAALNTGHEGGCGTVHANSSQDVPARFEALGVAAGLSREAVQSQLAAALDLVIHVERDADGKRRLKEISLVEVNDGGKVVVVPAVISNHKTTIFTERSDDLIDQLGLA